ncbi:MAG: hypothetical protein IPH07_07230 [Deltaproteobacteria bacterium]|nr:hypothetical protein [Deltaproteobacteria bacterium]MBK8236529.1 hypothetical protein [Deltaproteobacteria bacterium]MBP7287791.1 hypothetical protein [Nannocystaceae bacterium]
MPTNEDDPLRIPSVARAEPTGAAEGAEAVEATLAAGSVEAAQATAVEQVTAGLAAGALDVDAATSMLVADAVTTALGPGADPALAAEIRAEVAALVAEDPTLASLLRA